LPKRGYPWGLEKVFLSKEGKKTEGESRWGIYGALKMPEILSKRRVLI